MSGASAPDKSDARAIDLFLVAGEVSGDHLGGQLIEALRAAHPQIAVRGVGGNAMQVAGLHSLFPMSDIAVMGFLPVVAKLPQLLRRIRETAQAIIDNPPDALIIIDSPDFTHRVARRVRKKLPHLPIIDYVSPTVWAWRPGRAARMRAYVDHVLALLPFEARAHEELGGPACTYVGHPLVGQLEKLRPNVEEAGRRESEPPLVLVLPGSRRSEITRLLDTFKAALELAHDRLGEIDAVLPAVEHLAGDIRAHVESWRIKPRIVLGETEKYAAFRQARAALAASGTVTLELALAQVPTTVAYKVSPIEEKIARLMIRTKWITLANIILDAPVMSEFIQNDATPEKLADDLVNLISTGEPRERQLAQLRRLDDIMCLPDGSQPADRAAQVVLNILAERRSQK